MEQVTVVNAKSRHRLIAAQVVGDCQKPKIQAGDIVVADLSGYPDIGDYVLYCGCIYKYMPDSHGVLLKNNYGTLRPDGKGYDAVLIQVSRKLKV